MIQTPAGNHGFEPLITIELPDGIGCGFVKASTQTENAYEDDSPTMDRNNGCMPDDDMRHNPGN